MRHIALEVSVAGRKVVAAHVGALQLHALPTKMGPAMQ